MHLPPHPPSPARVVPCALATLALLLVAACGGDDDTDPRVSRGDGTLDGTASDLPVPEGSIGSVTGMPANPGAGTSRITLAEPAPAGPAGSTQGAWSTDAYADAYGDADHDTDAYADLDVDAYTAVEGAEAVDVPAHAAADSGDPLAEAPPIIIVPELPRDVVDVEIVPDAPAPTAPRRGPTGTEAATESTTIVVEPAESDD